MSTEYDHSKERQEDDLLGMRIIVFSSADPTTIGGVETCTRTIVEDALNRSASVIWAHPNRQDTTFPTTDWSYREHQNLSVIPLEDANPSRRNLRAPSETALHEWEKLLQGDNTHIVINFPSNFGTKLALAIPDELVGHTTLLIHGMIDLTPDAVSALTPQLQEQYYASAAERDQLRVNYQALEARGFRFTFVSERVRHSFERNGILQPSTHTEILTPPTNRCHTCSEVDATKQEQIRGDAEFVVLTVGRITPIKSLEHIIGVARELEGLVTSPKRIKFIIVGNNDGSSYSTQFQQQVREFNQSSTNCQIEIVNGIGDELCDYYKAADLFVQPSVTEALGLVTLEAASHGLPVLSWGEEDTLLTIQDLPALGFTIPFDSTNRELLGAQFISRMIYEDGLRDTLGGQARAIVLQQFNQQAITTQLVARISI